MKYVVTDAFTQISETTGTIQNASRSNLVEVSDSSVAGSGILLEPNDMFSFSGKTLYARCSDGKGAEVRVVPFEIGATSGGGDKTEIDPDIVYTPVTAAWFENPGSHLVLDGLTVNFDNQATVDEAGLMFYCNGEPINLGSYEVHPSDPKNNRYYLGNYTGSNSHIGLSIGAFTATAPAGKAEVICEGGSVTKDGTTYYYAPFTLTLNYAAKE